MAAGNHAVTHGPQQNVEHRHKSAGMKCNGYKVISSLKALPHMVQGGFLSDLRRFRAIPHNSKCRYGERGAADAVPQPPERCLSRKAGIVRCCLRDRNGAMGRMFKPDA